MDYLSNIVNKARITFYNELNDIKGLYLNNTYEILDISNDAYVDGYHNDYNSSVHTILIDNHMKIYFFIKENQIIGINFVWSREDCKCVINVDNNIIKIKDKLTLNFGNLKHLKHLLFINCIIESTLFLKDNKTLVKLQLKDCEIIKFVDCISSIINLEELFICGTKCDGDIKNLSKLENLNTIDTYGSKGIYVFINDIIYCYKFCLKSCQSIRHINLNFKLDPINIQDIQHPIISNSGHFNVFVKYISQNFYKLKNNYNNKIKLLLLFKDTKDTSDTFMRHAYNSPLNFFIFCKGLYLYKGISIISNNMINILSSRNPRFIINNLGKVLKKIQIILCSNYSHKSYLSMLPSEMIYYILNIIWKYKIYDSMIYGKNAYIINVDINKIEY